MIRQSAVYFDPLGTAFLAIVFLTGCWLGALACVSDCASRWKPLALSFVAVVASMLLVGLLDESHHGFTVASLATLTPGILGLWALTKSFAQASNARPLQFSSITLIRFVFCLAVTLATMGILARHGSHNRHHQAMLLLQEAKMTLTTPSADKTISLCNEAIRLAPDMSEAYGVRATAYEQRGDTQQAARDRRRAEDLSAAR